MLDFFFSFSYRCWVLLNYFLWPCSSWKQTIFPAEVFVEMMLSWQDLTVGLPSVPTLSTDSLTPIATGLLLLGSYCKSLKKQRIRGQPQNLSIGEERRKTHLVFKKTLKTLRLKTTHKATAEKNQSEQVRDHLSGWLCVQLLMATAHFSSTLINESLFWKQSHIAFIIPASICSPLFHWNQF